MMGASTVYPLTQYEGVASLSTRRHLWVCAIAVLKLHRNVESST